MLSRTVRGTTVLVESLFFLIAFAGVLVRVLGLPLHVADSGDEWGNAIASFRVLFNHGDPKVFIHPALYYDVTALAYAGVFAVLRILGVGGDTLSMTDLFLLDQRYFIYTARAVSVLSAVLAIAALYGFGRTLWSRPAGLAAAALLAVLPLQILYSNTVRVDALFLLVFLYAFARIVRLLWDKSARAHAIAGLATGLAAGANYNGGILVLWLIAAHFLTAERGESGAPSPVTASAPGWRWLVGALALAALGFFATNPYILLNFTTFAAHFLYQAGLSMVAHPGWEARGYLFYAEDLAAAGLPLSLLLGSAATCALLFGDRRERFVLSLPVVYVLLFSAMLTREDRFVLPALAVLLLIAAGLPALLSRRLRAWPALAAAASLLSYAGIFAAIATLAPTALTIPQPRPYEILPRFESGVVDWIESQAPPRSSILIESGIVPLIDTLNEPGSFAAALRRSRRRFRPGLEHRFVGAVFVGGCNYDAGVVTRREIDFAIIAPRNRQYVEQHCDSFPEVCAFYAALAEGADLVLEAPLGFEPVAIYRIRDT